jgi:putative intracellular protease/amidase
MSRTSSKKILIALTSHGDLAGLRSTGTTCRRSAHPWQVFRDAGYTVDFVSTPAANRRRRGGPVRPVQKAFVDDEQAQAKVRRTPRFADVDPAGYDAVLFAVATAPCGTSRTTRPGRRRPRRLRAGRRRLRGLPRPRALVGITLSDGRPLVAGKQVARVHQHRGGSGGLTGVVPFLLQSRLEELGAKHTSAPNFTEHVVSDERLVTGQNPASAAGVARAVLAALQTA